MALIGKIRQKTGLAVTLIALGLGLFVVGGDLLSPNSKLFGRDTTVGEIAGQEISYEEYQAMLKQFEENFRNNRGVSPTEADMTQIHDELWNQFILKKAMSKEFEKLGIMVHEEELIDLIQGNNVHPQLRQQFTDESGVFNKANLISYLQFIGQNYDAQRMPVSEQQFYRIKSNFIKFENELPSIRQSEKFSMLLAKSVYVTNLEAKTKYMDDNQLTDAKAIFVPFYSILDTTIQLTDSDIEKYVKENAKMYEQEASISMEYVVFPIIASTEDSLEAKKELEDMKEAFLNSDDDSLFVRAKADNYQMPVYLSLGNLPEAIQNAYPQIDSNMIFGPYLEGGNYKLYKVSGVKSDSISSARASHILFKAKSASDEDLAEALKECKKVLQQIQGGANFAEMASVYGTDGTSTRGGDLGWFKEADMVKEFNDAVMAAKKTGVLPQPVKTQFGYHIINVTAIKTNINYRVAIVDRNIVPGEDTRDEAFRLSGTFASENKTLEQFNAAFENNKALSKLKADNIKQMDRYLRGAGSARQAIMWAFNDAEVGSISQNFELEDGYVVCALISKSEKGIPSVEDARALVSTKVRNEKKAQQIIEKLTSLSGSLEDIQKAYGNDAKIVDLQRVSMSTLSFSSIGFEPTLAGTLSALPQGQKSSPIVGENGVLIIEVLSKADAQPKDNFLAEKSQMLSQVTSKTRNYALEAVKEAANIEDKRVKFF